MLRDSGVECEHGGHYEDPVTKKSREFDIRAIKTIDYRRVRMAVECKNIRENFPILVSCVPRHEQESYHQIALVHEPKTDTSIYQVHSSFQPRAKTLNIEGKYSFYECGKPVGKSTVQVGRSMDGSLCFNDSELYEKWGQCLSSADELVGRVNWDGENNNELYFSTVFPFVVVPNNRLWMVIYDENGNKISDPTQTDRCSCFIDKEYSMGNGITGDQLRLSHVEIVTFNGMKKFIADHLITAEGMAQIFPQQGIADALRN